MAVRSRRACRGLPVLAVVLAASTLVAACGSSTSDGARGSTAAGGSAGADGGSVSSPLGSTINVGTIGAFSGALAASGDPIRDAVLAWSKSVNNGGGINGHPVKVYVQDDKGDPAASVQALRTLVESDHVVALVGVFAQGTEQMWGDYLLAHNVPVVGGVQATSIWTTNPMYFGVSTGPAIKAQVYLLGPKAEGATKNFGMYCSEISQCADVANETKSYASKVGVDWVGSVAVSASAANYAPVCLQAKSSGATAITAILPASDFGRVAETCHQQGFDPIYAANSASLTPNLLKSPYLNKMVTFLNSFPIDSPVAAKYTAAMQKYYPDDDLATSQGQTGWTGGSLFQEALKGISPSEPVSSQTVLDGLNSITNDDLGGLLPQGITFRKGTPHPQMSCSFIAHVMDQKLVSDKKPLCSVD